MSELLKWRPQNEDDEPNMHLVLPTGDEVNLDRTNTHLVTHLGHLATFDFVAYDELEEEPTYPAFRVFRFVEGFETMRKYMMETGYHMELNRPYVDPQTQEMYYRAQASALDDELDSL